MKGDVLAAVPTDLAAEGRRLVDAASEVEQVSVRLRAPLPPMPPDVAGYVEGELGWTQVALSQIEGALLDEARTAGRRGQLFDFAGEGGLTVAVGGTLSTVEQWTNPWVDGLERVLIAPRYLRTGTWVRAYSYVNKYGTVVNVGKHWRNLPNKLMDEKPVFAGIGEDSKLVEGVKIASIGGYALTFVTSGLEEWETDAGAGTADRVADSLTVAGATTGGAWAAAESGALFGSTIGEFVGPEGAVVGGIAGALIGGFAGSKLGNSIGRALAEVF